VSSTKIRAIIFDVGRVLVRVEIARAMSGLASGLSLSPADLWSAIEKDPHWQDWQEGRMRPHEWYLHLNKRLGSSLSFDQFREVWNRALDPEPMQDSGFLEKLAKRYRLALLSNTDPIHISYLEATYDFFRFFPVRIYSCTAGVSKPNPLIYEQALRACKVRAPEAIYVDDVAAYAEAARRLGMAGIQYVSPAQLRADLQASGIEIT